MQETVSFLPYLSVVMELATAISLIQPAISPNFKTEQWADLGSGSGLFTRALASCLSPGSTIFAIDRLVVAEKTQTTQQHVAIHQITANFIDDDLPADLDGILMANALHFVSDKPLLLLKLKRSLKPAGKLVIVEYDMDSANKWVPFPISFKTLHAEFGDFFASLTKLAVTSSVYQRSGLYSALLTFHSP